MPGIEDVQPKQISSLGQAMVPTIEPVVTQDAMTKLTNAFRQGWITTNDILDRAREQDKQNLVLQRAREEVSPEQVAARKAKAEAETAVSLQSKAEQNNKFAYERFLKSGRALPRDEQGNVDHTAVISQGSDFLQADEEMKTALMGLQSQPKIVRDSKGNAVVLDINAAKENVSYGSEAYKRYQKMLSHSSHILHGTPELSGVPAGAHPAVDLSQTPGAPAATTPAAAAPVVVPAAPPGSVAALPVPGRVYGAPPVEIAPKIPSAVFPLTDWTQQVPVIHGGPAPSIVIPQQAAPVITPVAPPVAAAPPVIQPGVVPAGGMDITGAVPYLNPDFKPDEYMKEVRSSELYKNWAEKTPAIAGFRATARAYQDKPAGAITVQDDIDLANSALQIASPGTTAGGRGMEAYRINRIEDSIPYLERFLDIKAVTLKEHKFPKETRERIIAATERKAQEIEKLGRDTLHSAQERLTTEYRDPAKYLFEPEKQLISGSTRTTSVPGGTITLPSGRQLIWSQ